MTNRQTARYTAFCGATRVASGELAKVALRAKTAMDRDKWAQVLIFNDVTSELVEVDFRGTSKDVLRRLEKRESAATIEPPKKWRMFPEDRGVRALAWWRVR